jgi:hypothetical protein
MTRSSRVTSNVPSEVGTRATDMFQTRSRWWLQSWLWHVSWSPTQRAPLLPWRISPVVQVKRNELMSSSSWLLRPKVKVEWFVFGKSRVQISARRPAILSWVFSSFSSSFQANAGIVPYWLLLLLSLRGGTVQSVSWTAAIFWTTMRLHLISNHAWFILQRHLVAKQRVGKKYPWI